MSFEPFGYGDKLYDRVGGLGLKPKEFAVLLLVAVIVAIIWKLS